MNETKVLDLEALRQSADGRAEIERQMLLLYIGVADQCLEELRGLVVESNTHKWRSAVYVLRDASAKIHAEQLTALCETSVALYNPDNASSRMYMYTQLADAYQAVMLRIRANNLLMLKSVHH